MWLKWVKDVVEMGNKKAKKLRLKWVKDVVRLGKRCGRNG